MTDTDFVSLILMARSLRLTNCCIVQDISMRTVKLIQDEGRGDIKIINNSRIVELINKSRL